MKTWWFVALLGVSVRVGAEPIVELAFDRDRVVVQGRYECFPSSIYNVLQTARRALPGYAEFLKAVGDRPARRSPGCLRFQSERTEYCQYEGTRNDELRAMMREATRSADMPEMQSGFLSRRKGERGQAFIRRIHGELLASVRGGLPVVTRILLYQGEGQFGNHAHMIFGISDEPFLDRDKGWAFRLKIFEQEWGGGRVLEVLVHERYTREPEPHIARIVAPGETLEFAPSYRVHHGYVGAFAEMEMRRADGGWEPLYARELADGGLAPVFLELAFGRFDEANLTPAFGANETATAAVE